MVTFLSLPGEIRNAIYDMVLFPCHTHIPVHATHWRDLDRTIFQSPLHDTCNTVRAELFARLCKTKTLVFSSYKSYKVFMKYSASIDDDCIAASNLQAISIQVQHISWVDHDKAAYHIRGLTMIDADQAFTELGALKTVELTTPLDPDQPFVILERKADGTFARASGADTDYPPKAIFGALNQYSRIES